MQMLGGCWFIEQPASSRLAWYPRFEWLCRSLWSKAWQIGWWARHFKALTPKRHRAWSNSKEISVLNRGVLTKKERDACPVKTTDRSVKVVPNSIWTPHAALHSCPALLWLRQLGRASRGKRTGDVLPDALEHMARGWVFNLQYVVHFARIYLRQAGLEAAVIYMRGSKRLM
ncbi:unnamed protein product, partial [Durusdinium trenchii]